LTKKKKVLQISLGLGVTFACFWFAIPGSGVNEKWEGAKSTVSVLGDADYWWLVPLMGLLALFFLTKAYRWAILLSPIHRFNSRQVFPATMIGFMGNNILPIHLGDVVRMYVLSKNYALSKTAVFSTIVLERVLDGVAAAILFTFVAWSLKLSSAIKLGGTIGAAAVIFLLIFLVYYVHRTEKIVRLWEKWLRFLPKRLNHKLDRMIRKGAHGLETLKYPPLVLYLLFISIIHWAILGLYAYVVFQAFSLDLPFAAALLLLCVTMVGVMLPAAPGYWGVIQAVFTFTLTPLGVPQGAALAASIYYLASQAIPTTLTGLIFMGHMGFRLGELKSQAEEEATDAS
jgi:glycosyltransferase 2 family protein